MNIRLPIMIVLALTAGVFTAAAVADRSEIPVVDQGQHLLLDMVQETDGSFRVLHETVVHSSLPRRRGRSTTTRPRMNRCCVRSGEPTRTTSP